ncbi:MAG TPA: hypothetical protein VGU71_22535 [Candidatus Dormibacteraeota bacterium]|nr:hypothetical protein [Candidatus Dormibacteraeota bacterium]
MDTYVTEVSNSKAIVLRHQGEDDHSIEIHEGATGASGSGGYAPVPQSLQAQVAEGKRYTVSISFYEVKDAPATSAPKATKPEKAAKPAVAKKPGVNKAVIADLEDKIEDAAKTVKSAARKAVKKAPIKSAAKSQSKKATRKS